MLSRTFRHLDGIGEIRERELWNNGVQSWDDLQQLDAHQLQLFDKFAGRYEALLADSRQQLERGNVEHFAEALPSAEHYRILLTFPTETIFLDIETTGLSRHYDHITMVGWNLDREYDAWVKGQLDDKLREALESAKVIVTFNGSLFDLPFLRQEFPEVSLPSCHVDLRYLAARVDLKGGQKAIEHELGLEREGLEDLRGENAPALWYKYTWGDTDAMRRLVAYNRADVMGMKFILDEAVQRLLDENGLPLPLDQVVTFSDEFSELDLSSPEESPLSVPIEPFEGRAGPEITISDLNTSADVTIVGIDLTGSEDRGSGWCVVRDRQVGTEVLYTDDELVEATQSVDPDVVSIDSPLSLPQGRNRVDDSDPAREEHGIMRECERTLKKRGINVYPCLIPSMQQLTQRGIALATELRSEGVPVIESYPGAAQDIMGIPRKGADEELLRRGLEAFGLKGRVTSQDLNHDELDAITSAVVGVFFWSGQYEALGTPQEDYLIVPNLDEEAGWDRQLVVGLSGPIAAGKTTAGRLLEEIGFEYVRYSQVLKKIAEERGLTPTRDVLQSLGAEVNEQTQGQRWLNREMLEHLGTAKKIVVDGLRHPEDHSFLVEQFGPHFLHVYLEADVGTRRQRYVSSQSSEEDFRKAGGHRVENEVPRLRELAHRVIENDATVSRLQDQVHNLDSARRLTS